MITTFLSKIAKILPLIESGIGIQEKCNEDRDFSNDINLLSSVYSSEELDQISFQIQQKKNSIEKKITTKTKSEKNGNSSCPISPEKSHTPTPRYGICKPLDLIDDNLKITMKKDNKISNDINFSTNESPVHNSSKNSTNKHEFFENLMTSDLSRYSNKHRLKIDENQYQNPDDINYWKDDKKNVVQNMQKKNKRYFTLGDIDSSSEENDILAYKKKLYNDEEELIDLTKKSNEIETSEKDDMNVKKAGACKLVEEKLHVKTRNGNVNLCDTPKFLIAFNKNFAIDQQKAIIDSTSPIKHHYEKNLHETKISEEIEISDRTLEKAECNEYQL